MFLFRNVSKIYNSALNLVLAISGFVWLYGTKVLVEIPLTDLSYNVDVGMAIGITFLIKFLLEF